MPAQSNIVINDGATTPVSHTFTAAGASRLADGRQLADWIDYGSSEHRVGQFVIQEVQRPANGSGNEQIEWAIRVPTMKVMGDAVVGFEPAPMVDYVDVGRISVTISQRSSEAWAAHLAAFMKNFVATTYFTDKVKRRERTT